MRLPAIIAVLLCPSLVSCAESPTEGSSLAGMYVLQGTPITLVTQGGQELTILADTFYLGLGAGPVHRSVSYRWTGSDDAVYEVQSAEQYYVYLRRQRLEFGYVCPPNALAITLALCTPPPHLWGRPTSGGLALHHAYAPATTLHYERQPSNVRVQ